MREPGARSVLLPRVARTYTRVALVLLCTIGVVPEAPLAWGPDGHRLVAVLAEARLEKHVKAQVFELAGPGGLADVATWADEIRRARPDTRPWHYVNIPPDAEAYQPQRACVIPREGDCVVAAIERFQSILANAHNDREVRAEALRFVTHFVADIHQPLHCLGAFAGGNTIEVHFLGEATNPFNDRPWNLHAVWDSGLIRRSGVDEEVFEARLNAKLDATVIEMHEQDGPREWAMESNRVASETALKLLRAQVVDIAYLRLSLPVIEDRLVLAAARLARLLNEALAARD